MKKIFALLLITAISIFSLVACFGPFGDPTPENPCEDGHTFTTYNSNNDATCTEDGTTTAKCEKCDVTDTVIDEGTAKGHSFGEWETVKEATCTENGSSKRVCGACGTSEEREESSPGHSFNTETYGYQGADGHAHRCTVCGEKDTVEAHTPGAAATETEAQKCTVCEYIIAPPVGHTHAFTNEAAEERTLKSVATCDAAAVYYKSCSCGAVSDEYTFDHGDALGHDYAAATCTAPKTCKRCPATDGEPNGHEWGEWVITKPATGVSQGEKKRECENCDEVETAVIPQSGNMDNDGWTQIGK